MKQQKKEFKFFTVSEYEKEQDYLREMHNHGWEFKRVTGLGMYHFEECEPADVIYQLDYNKEGIAHKEEYVQMFADCGWEYMQDFFGFSYFRKPIGIMNEDEGIFCDDESRLEFMKRLFRGRFVPLLIIFFMIIIPQLIMQYRMGEYGLVLMFAALLIVYLSIFIWYGKRYHDFKARIYKG
ncbi:MAG: DUF2812 domain-containing protein [Lachnospiraceae bacterium]|nr:DUF2812 domain-containing protein [Lachnospiraceae bacterium]